MGEKRKWQAASLAVVFVVNILLISLIQGAQAATWRQGSTGETVRTIQTKLQRWGYYDGEIDGIFGSATAEAVRYFQRKNGLAVDGVVGPATLKALGMSTGSGSSGSTSQSGSLDLLARVGGGPGGALQRPGGGGGGDPQPGGAPLLPQHHRRGGLPAGGLHLHGGRAN